MAKIRKTVTMADIARKMDVSVVTVSKALSGQKGVSSKVREQILDLARELGYENTRAGGEEQIRSTRVGVLIPAGAQGLSGSFYWRMYQAVADQAVKRSCFTSYESLTGEMVEQSILPRILQEGMVDGLIVIGRPGKGYGRFLKEQMDIPLVFMDFYEDFRDVDCFISDGFYGTYQLTNYLFERGHRDIAYVGTLFATESITDRYLGYLKAQMEHGITPPADHIIPDREMAEGLGESYQSFRLPEPLPTAFVCNCDSTAAFLVRDLGRRGLRVPEDVSVVGYDNYLDTMYQERNITTYSVDIDLMAGEAVHTLIRRMNGEECTPGIHIIEGALVEKDSVADIRKKGERKNG